VKGGEFNMAFIYDLDNEYGARFIGDGGEANVLEVKSASAAIPSLLISRSVAGNASQAPLRFAGTSVASGAVMGFRSAVSLTSIILTSAAHFDYAIPVEINGETRYIPVVKATGLSGAAAFS
jgi:hypothetical protein